MTLLIHLATAYPWEEPNESALRTKRSTVPRTRLRSDPVIVPPRNHTRTISMYRGVSPLARPVPRESLIRLRLRRGRGRALRVWPKL